MNEQIRELAEQAGFIKEDGGNNLHVFDGYEAITCTEELKKFAELLVSKCIRAVEGTPLGYGDYRDQILLSMRESCVESIMYEFGVE